MTYPWYLTTFRSVEKHKDKDTSLDNETKENLAIYAHLFS